MAGILDNKQRVMDFVITREGLRQAGTGQMRIKFASFTDHHTFYEASGSAEIPELAADASNRIFFETHNRYQDVIVPELEAGYSLRPFRTANFEVVGGTITSGTLRTGISNHPNILSGAQLAKNIAPVLDGITNNFKEQRIIGTLDEFSLYQELKLSPSTGSFTLDDNTNFLRAGTGKENEAFLDFVPSLFSDRRFAHFPNFKFLPPVNLPRPGENSSQPLGQYVDLGERNIITIEELEASLANKQKVDILFSETSRRNNLAIQFFEQEFNAVDKLSIVDFGSFEDNDSISPGKRVFYVGKIMRDGDGAETFMCIFTVVID
jgi:hypothetical protein